VITDVPAETPANMPELEPMVPIAVDPEVQLPPPGVEVNVTFVPPQIDVMPLIAPGADDTVTVCVA
jgi:hypothetical protein